ncbi:MAG TPA: hypothetical protein VJN64_11975 [Terriglobales bacterium]|nr:hypothetical protein [Terriglobales bacterium]
MSFLKELKDVLGRDAFATEISQINETNPLFVYIKIPAQLDPLERSELFGDPLQEALERERLGTVTGGGSLSAPDDDDGSEIEFCGIDVDLYDPEKGITLLHRELIRLEAPPDTVLLYELNGREWEDPIYPKTVC